MFLILSIKSLIPFYINQFNNFLCKLPVKTRPIRKTCISRQRTGSIMCAMFTSLEFCRKLMRLDLTGPVFRKARFKTHINCASPRRFQRRLQTYINIIYIIIALQEINNCTIFRELFKLLFKQKISPGRKRNNKYLAPASSTGQD